MLRPRARCSTSYLVSILGVIAIGLLPVPSEAQVNSVAFRAADAKYSVQLDRLIMISANPNQLHIYDTAANADVTVALSDTPLSLAVSPDGTHAAVVHASSIEYVNLQTPAVEQDFSIATYTNGIMSPVPVTIGNGYIYAFVNGSILSINLVGGAITVGGFGYENSGVFDPGVNAIYATVEGASPGELERFDISGGPVGGSTLFPSWYLWEVCGPLWISPDSKVIYSSCGTAFSSSSDAAKDMVYLGSLSGLVNVQSLTTSASLNQIAAIPQAEAYEPPGQTLPTDSEVRIFEASYRSQTGRFALMPFTVGGTNYAAHGKWVFYNASSSKLIVVAEADSTAGLLNDFEIQQFSTTSSVPCNATFADTTVSAPASGVYAAESITSESTCTYLVNSNSSWITPASNYYGAGSQSVTYVVRPNLSNSSRTGTLTMGTQTLTVVQSAAGAATDFHPLSYKLVSADYDKALDKIVTVGKSPNELHLYDPVSQSDQTVPLAGVPLSVSVAPDGNFAAVGQDGFISYVDLNAKTVNKLIPVDFRADNIVLAGNGYVYGSPTTYPLGELYSTQISTGTVTSTSSEYDGDIPRLYASGESIYMGGVGSSKWDISNGPAVLQASSPFEDTWPVWLSEDGNRLIDGVGKVFFTSAIPAQDRIPDGALSGTESVAWAADSQIQHEIAVLSGGSDDASGENTQLQIYADNGLTLSSQEGLPEFGVGSATYASQGRFVFWNAAATKLFVIEQASVTSGLLSDFAEYTVDAPQSIPACTYTLSPPAVSFGPAYANGFFDVTSNCSWSVQTAQSWITSYDSATGNGRVTFSAQSNSGAARSGNIAVGTANFVIAQAGSDCSYTLSAAQGLFGSNGGSGTVSLTTGPNCAWTVQSDSNWLTVTSSSSGSGPATISFSVPRIASPSGQSGNLNIAGVDFPVIQSSAPSITPVALNFVPVAPCRVADTRNPNGPFGGPFLAANSSRAFVVPESACNIPASAAAYSMNVTAIPHKTLGYLTVWPTDAPQPYVSTLNSIDGRIKANAVITPAGTAGAVSAFVTDDTDLVFDINGYFVPPSVYIGNEFYPLTPCRAADTRNAEGSLGGPSMTAGGSRDLPIETSCQLTSPYLFVSAYSLNMTAIPLNGVLGFLTVWPTGQKQPYVSTLNAFTGATTANAAILPAGNNGAISAFTTDASDLVVDANGYFGTPSTTGLHFYPVQPCRVLDTRNINAGLPFIGQLTVLVAGACNIPESASAYVMNATVVPTGPLGFLSLWPSGMPQPLVSTLNAFDGQITSNMAIVPAAGGSIDAYASQSTHLILDVSGYFAP